MKSLNRLELIVTKVALLLDEYAFTYSPYEYKSNIGTMEIHRVRHVNDLIHYIGNNGSEFTSIIKSIADDIDYLEYEIKESLDDELVAQLNDARRIFELLNEIA